METQQKIIDTNNIFSGRYLDCRALYMYSFNSVPCIGYVEQIDGERAFGAVKEKYATMIESIHSYRFYRRKKMNIEFDETVIILNNKCILEFDGWYCEMLYDYSAADFVKELVEFLKAFKERQKRKPLEIN